MGELIDIREKGLSPWAYEIVCGVGSPTSIGDIMSLAKQMKANAFDEWELHDLMLKKWAKMSKAEKKKLRGQISWAWKNAK